MSTFQPREPYSQDELAKLYPQGLRLQLVQILLRHGERTPVSPRFQNAGLKPYWPYCAAAKQLRSVIKSTDEGSEWTELKYRRRLETFASDDRPVVTAGPNGEFDIICQPGELTDKGRETTLALGQRLRALYVHQLGFMPALISDSDMIYLRTTPLPRALESVQQAFWGMYPPNSRTETFPEPTILTRAPADETLYPNDTNCRRFAQLSRAFAERTAARWNTSEDMDYLTRLIGKWMPRNSPRVAVDSHPRLSGIMDTINATAAHSPHTRLPAEFYDKKGREIIDRIGVEEWYSGYGESAEYRSLGIGALAGDIVTRMVGSVERNFDDGLLEVSGDNGAVGRGQGGEEGIKLALSGCHDTSIAGLLAGLGAFDGEKWPPYTSHVAIELFKQAEQQNESSSPGVTPPVQSNTSQSSITSTGTTTATTFSSLWQAIFGRPGSSTATISSPSPSPGIGRKPTELLTQAEKDKLRGYFVRIRYNDRVVTVPGCRLPGKHLEGDQSFCTLETFKAIVDKFTPRNWKESCAANLDQPAFPAKIEPAGYE